MVLVGYGSNNYRLKVIVGIFISNKELVIVSPVITIHTLRKKREIKTPYPLLHNLNWLKC